MFKEQGGDSMLKKMLVLLVIIFSIYGGLFIGELVSVCVLYLLYGYDIFVPFFLAFLFYYGIAFVQLSVLLIVRIILLRLLKLGLFSSALYYFIEGFLFPVICLLLSLSLMAVEVLNSAWFYFTVVPTVAFFLLTVFEFLVFRKVSGRHRDSRS